LELLESAGDKARVKEQRDGFRHGLADLVERDVLPLLNLMVLLLPLVLFGVELAARSAMAVTLPDTSPDVAQLDTPSVQRPSALGLDDHKRAVESELATRIQASEAELPATGPSVFSDSPLGYGE
jgi:biopolymer transport protein ExbD